MITTTFWHFYALSVKWLNVKSSQLKVHEKICEMTRYAFQIGTFTLLNVYWHFVISKEVLFGNVTTFCEAIFVNTMQYAGIINWLDLTKNHEQPKLFAFVRTKIQLFCQLFYWKLLKCCLEILTLKDIPSFFNWYANQIWPILTLY